ncbi:putative MFS-type transporter C09D4.1 [Trichonephila clavipes]|nr:putative MFS-type transporter C09D4.1 [Trichonephila clavipes]
MANLPSDSLILMDGTGHTLHNEPVNVKNGFAATRINKRVHHLVVSRSFMVGSYGALGTTLNSLILRFFPHKEVEIGWMGLLFVVCGLMGSMIGGFILDSTHKFKYVFLNSF